MSDISTFHPAVARWFAQTYAAPTGAQAAAWPAIHAGRDVLVAAPTGSGKTLAAFLAAIDQLIKEGAAGALPDETRVLYVSPLKALSNDIHRNLEAPLEGIRGQLAALGLPDVELTTMVRTGDTSAAERARMRRKAPHIVVTTPESLYVLLGSESGRTMLSTCRTVIVDEIHAVAGNKRGMHLALSLERLQAIAGRRMARIGLSATQTPIDEVARFLIGSNAIGPGDLSIVDSGHDRNRDLALELPPAPLEAVMSGEAWTQVYERLARLVRNIAHAGIRQYAQARGARGSASLGARGEEMSPRITAACPRSGGSMPSSAEARRLKVLVATASLELGIDIGDVDLVCQIGSTAPSTPSCSAWDAPDIGRAAPPRGGCFRCRATNWWSAPRCSMRCGAANSTACHPLNALDVLAQQMTAEVSAREWTVDALFGLVRARISLSESAARGLRRCVRMLAEGFSTRRGRRGALHASRRHQQDAAASQGRQAHCHHLGRRYSGQRRLPGDART